MLRSTPSGAPGVQSSGDFQRQLDALNVAERLRGLAVPTVDFAAPATMPATATTGAPLPTTAGSNSAQTPTTSTGGGAATGSNLANSSATMLSTTNTTNATTGGGTPAQPQQVAASHSLGAFLGTMNPQIAPIFHPDEARGGRAILMKLLAELHIRKGQALPPSLTGVPSPTYNPATSPFKFDVVGLGIVKVAGQDIDLLKLWQNVFNSGMSQKLNRDNLWGHLASQMGLPMYAPDTGMPIANLIKDLYSFFSELEMHLMRMMQSAHAQAQARRHAGGSAQMHSAQPSGDLAGAGVASQSNAVSTPVSTATAMGTPAPSATPGATTPAHGSSEDSDTRKRKAEDDDDESKRKLRKLDEEGGSGATDGEGASSPVKEEPVPEGPLLRRKIEYVPVTRTLKTYGGRDIDAINAEYAKLSERRPLKVMADFGVVDVEALILQLRSRLKIEVTTALGILYHLSSLRGGESKNTGLQLSMCEDLTDELLDLLEETAFGANPDSDDPEDARLDASTRIVTNKEIVRNIQYEGSNLFAGLAADLELSAHLSPTHQPWEIVMLIVTILSTVSSADENPAYLAQQPRLLDILTRICMIHPSKNRGDPVKPVSSVLQPRHLIRIRKEVVSLISTIGRHLVLNQSPSRATRRLYILLASTLMDPEECETPGSTERSKPSTSMDLALECFTLMAHLDPNRKVITAEIPWEQLWKLMQLLVRIIPLTDTDIQRATTEQWLSFILKVAQALYSLAICAPLPMRRKMKLSPSLRGALTRHLRIGTTNNTAVNGIYRALQPDVRGIVDEYWRRLGETLKVIDAEEDPLAPTSTGAGGVIGYGIGGSYDLHLGAKPPARGTGMFAGSRGDMLWSIMVASAIQNDAQAFEEWDYMLRVDTSTASRVAFDSTWF